MKWWSYNDGGLCLAQASDDGSLFFTCQEGPAPSTLELQEKADVDVTSPMCIYVDWNPARSNPEVVLTISDGSISTVNLQQSQEHFPLPLEHIGFHHALQIYTTLNCLVLLSKKELTAS